MLKPVRRLRCGALMISLCVAKAKTLFPRLVTQTAHADPERPALKVAKAFRAKR